ncbi:SPOSA6832_01615, partial [Sporobolomyces salmonicolor]
MVSITPSLSDFRPIYVPTYPARAIRRTSLPPSTVGAPSVAALSADYGKDKNGEALVRFGITTPQKSPTQLRRQLKLRHMQKAGPLGLLAYFIVVSLHPHRLEESGHITLASRTVDSAFGMAVGWTSCANWLLVFPAELSAAAVLVSLWSDAKPSYNPAAWIASCYVCVLAVNFGGTRVYGEIEWAVAFVKVYHVALPILSVFTILAFIILGIIISACDVPGTEFTGFTYWRSPGVFAQYLGIPGALGRFAGFWSVLTQAAYADVGSEIISLAAAEARNPSRSLPRAIHPVVFRIALFYIVGVFVIGLVVPSNDSALGKQDGTALSSPFVIAIERAGIKVRRTSRERKTRFDWSLEQALFSIANAAFLTSATSAASSGLHSAIRAHSEGNFSQYTSSRCLYGFAINGNAPQIFTRINSYGLPYVSVCACSLFGLLSFMSVRSYYGAKAQDIPREVFPYKSSFQPYAAYYALIVSGTPRPFVSGTTTDRRNLQGLCVILFTQGFDVFIHDNWSIAEFVTKYLMIPMELTPNTQRTVPYRLLCHPPVPAMRARTSASDNDKSEELPPKGALQRLWYALA